MSQPIGRTIITASSAVTATRTGRERSSWRADLQEVDERTGRSAVPASDLEDPGILRLDLVGHLLDLDRILAHGLDRAERRPAGLGLDLQVGRILAAQVDE